VQFIYLVYPASTHPDTDATLLSLCGYPINALLDYRDKPGNDEEKKSFVIPDKRRPGRWVCPGGDPPRDPGSRPFAALGMVPSALDSGFHIPSAVIVGLVPAIHSVTFPLNEPQLEWTPGINPGVTKRVGPEGDEESEAGGRKREAGGQSRS